MCETDNGVPNPSRHVELDIDIGADAKDWSAIQAGEKLQPVETELRRIEEMVAEVVAELDYLRIREQKLRDTNESTNERVKWFAFGTMGMLVGLGAWQIVYLRAYFRYVSELRFTSVTSLHHITDQSTSSRRDARYNAFHVISGCKAASVLCAAMVHRYCISNCSLLSLSVSLLGFSSPVSHKATVNSTSFPARHRPLFSTNVRSRCHVWLHIILCTKPAIGVFVPVTLGALSGVGEVLLGEFDERMSIVDREIATFVDQRLHRV